MESVLRNRAGIKKVGAVCQGSSTGQLEGAVALVWEGNLVAQEQVDEAISCAL